METDNTVITTILQQCENYISEEVPLNPYHIIYGYVKLLCMNDFQLRVLLKKEESIQELKETKTIFTEKHLDITLLKMGLPYLFPLLRDEQQESLCRDFVNRIKKKEEISSKELLFGIMPKNTEVLDVFCEGNTIKNVLEYQSRCKEKKEQEHQAELRAEFVQVLRERLKKLKEKPAQEVPAKKNVQYASLQKMSHTFKRLRTDILKVVKGQDDAVLEFVEGCFQGEVLNSAKGRKLPKATFLFVGPPGVGKTLLAQTAAEILGYPYKLFNMSEYSAHQSHEGLIGVSSFYNQSEEGILVKFVRENPKCVLVFDEIEKAHRNVIQLFLQILDQGVLDNAYKKEKTEFKDAFIIFTSNACSSIYENNFDNISRTPKNVLLQALRSEINPTTGVPAFPDAICSRIAAGNLIMFNHIGAREMAKMVRDNFQNAARQIKEEYGLEVTLDRRLPLLFLFHQGIMLDARIASRQSDKFIKNEIFELSRQLESHTDLLDGIHSIDFEIDLDSSNTDPDIQQLFENKQRVEIIVVCAKKDRKLFDLSEQYHVQFVDTSDKLKKKLNDDIALVLIDLLYGLDEEGIKGVSLDDYYSTGVNAFKEVEDSKFDIPVYLLETGERLKETDRSSFFRRGAAGIVSVLNEEGSSVRSQIQQITEDQYIQMQEQELGRRGYILEFNTAQIPNGSTLKILYHDLRKQKAVDAENAAVFVSDAERPKTRFDEVIGAENAKAELKYFINYLSNPRQFIREKKKPPKGVLLYGPSGTGKTMLARAMAGESDVAFIQTSATELLNKYVGQSEQNIRNLFKTAKRYAPAIIFIDEIDAIGKSRTGVSPGAESALNALLTEMDGFKTDVKKPVFVLAATNYNIDMDGGNRPVLDPALVRRFDNRILVDLPNEKERVQYLKKAVAENGFEEINDATIRNIAARTTGLSIANLQNILELASRNAGREERLPNGDDLQNALEEYRFGEKKDWGKDYYRSVAVHEAGHAYLAWKAGEKPSYLTIESRSDFGGYMEHESSENKPNRTKEDLIWRIRCSLAGRAAEEVFNGKDAALNTGASSDLQKATSYAIRMMCDYGMMEGQLVSLPFKTISGTSLAENYLNKVNELLQNEMAETIKLVKEGKNTIQKLADKLMKNNHLTGEEIITVLESANRKKKTDR